MSLEKCPLGVVWRKGFVRMLDSVFNTAKPYLLHQMKNPNNLVPVVVLNEQTKKSKCYFINSTDDGFDEITDPQGLCQRVDGIAEYMINKLKVQKSPRTIKEKEELCQLNERKNYNKEKLSANEEAKINAI